MSRIFRWDVPVDDKEHEIGSGPVVHVDRPRNANNAHVSVWTIEPDPPTADSGIPVPPKKVALVVGTGHQFDGWWWRHAGSVVVEPFVWHVLIREQLSPGGS